VEGYILDANDNKIALLAGKWDEYFYATNDVENAAQFYRQTEKLRECDVKKTRNFFDPNQAIQLIWKSNDPCEILPDFYNFTKFTLCLNEMAQELLQPSYVITNDTDSNRTLVREWPSRRSIP